jgi:hypothetical protein
LLNNGATGFETITAPSSGDTVSLMAVYGQVLTHRIPEIQRVRLSRETDADRETRGGGTRGKQKETKKKN